MMTYTNMQESDDSPADPKDVTRILSEIELGDPRRAEELLPLVYNELRRLARSKIAHQMPGQTLQGTALVHEAYLRLANSGNNEWNSRGHFFAAAAESMRRIIVDNIRRKGRLKRGGDQVRANVEIMDIAASGVGDDDQLLAVNEALDQLEASNPETAKLVKLRFFAGLTLTEAAQALELSERTAKRRWAYARAWLFDKMKSD
ncbi:MAG: ECF-type sigma factor [Verrucomicrobiales bacterium]